MAAYAIGRLEMRDPSWLQDYGPKTAALVAKHGGKYLVRGGAMERLEGTGPLPSVIVILEFPSMAQAQAWYHDESDTILLAHNVLFDLGFLAMALTRLDIAYPPHYVFDTLDMARRLYPTWPSNSLEHVASRLNVANGAAHRALSDAR